MKEIRMDSEENKIYAIECESFRVRINALF